MTEADVALALREATMVLLKLAGPPLLAMLVAGIVVSVLQAVTQINEASLAFLPKAAALTATLFTLGQFMLTSLTDYARLLFDRMIQLGGS